MNVLLVHPGRKIMCANPREKDVTRSLRNTRKCDWSDAAVVDIVPGRESHLKDSLTPAVNVTSVKVNSELERIVQSSSSNCLHACQSNKNTGLQGNINRAAQDANSEEYVDVLGVNCVADIAATTSGQSSVKEICNGAKKMPGGVRTACVSDVIKSADTRVVCGGDSTPTNSQRGEGSLDGVESIEKEDVTKAWPADVTRANCEELSCALALEDPSDFEDDNYNRFYFESDHMALKGNKHYQMLLQSLVALEAQRAQAIKDLDILCDIQKKTLSDPIQFVQKLQNNEPVNLPERQKVAKVSHVPWEEYTVQLGPLERQHLLSHHQTRSAAQQLEKVLSATQPMETEDTGSAVPEPPSSSSNAYSVFGGEFVTSKSGKTLERDGAFFGGQTEWKGARSRSLDESKPTSFNQAWTSEEQAKLERFLQIYPQEDVEAKRWDKVARALGNRTPKQVASRVQKYFIKLAKAGLPVPGRAPSLPKPGTRSKRTSHYQTLGFKNSTFFPSYQPRVYMNDDDDASSLALSDDTSYPSDEESIPSELKETEEYRELMHLKKMKRQKLHQEQRLSSQIQHHGFMCDGCGMDPIKGHRFHCQDCPQDPSVDFCADCVDRGMVTAGSHQPTHSLETVSTAPSFFVDGDYVDYNYLDTNFLPAAS